MLPGFVFARMLLSILSGHRMGSSLFTCWRACKVTLSCSCMSCFPVPKLSCKHYDIIKVTIGLFVEPKSNVATWESYSSNKPIFYNFSLSCKQCFCQLSSICCVADGISVTTYAFNFVTGRPDVGQNIRASAIANIAHIMYCNVSCPVCPAFQNVTKNSCPRIHTPLQQTLFGILFTILTDGMHCSTGRPVHLPQVSRPWTS